VRTVRRDRNAAAAELTAATPWLKFSEKEKKPRLGRLACKGLS